MMDDERLFNLILIDFRLIYLLSKLIVYVLFQNLNLMKHS